MKPFIISAVLMFTFGPGLFPQSADAAGPCCQIKAIDAKTGVITVKENATGATCQYRVPDIGRLKTLKVGSAVDAVILPEATPVQGQGVTSQAAASGCGWNGSRNADTTVAKNCTDPKTGKRVACPNGN